MKSSPGFSLAICQALREAQELQEELKLEEADVAQLRIQVGHDLVVFFSSFSTFGWKTRGPFFFSSTILLLVGKFKTYFFLKDIWETRLSWLWKISKHGEKYNHGILNVACCNLAKKRVPDGFLGCWMSTFSSNPNPSKDTENDLWTSTCNLIRFSETHLPNNL